MMLVGNRCIELQRLYVNHRIVITVQTSYLDSTLAERQMGIYRHFLYCIYSLKSRLDLLPLGRSPAGCPHRQPVFVYPKFAVYNPSLARSNAEVAQHSAPTSLVYFWLELLNVLHWESGLGLFTGRDFSVHRGCLVPGVLPVGIMGIAFPSQCSAQPA